MNLLKAKQKALVEQIEKEKIQSNKGSSYKLLVEQAKLKQATSKVRIQTFVDTLSLRGRCGTTFGEKEAFEQILTSTLWFFFFQHFKDLIRLRRTAEWPRSTLDSEASVAKETPEVELPALHAVSRELHLRRPEARSLPPLHGLYLSRRLAAVRLQGA